MKLETVDEAVLSQRAAERVAETAHRAVAERGRFAVAFSGGRTPGDMFAALAELDVPWDRTHVCQVDERAAPDGHPDRNATMLRSHLLVHVPVPASHVHLMPAADADLDAAAARYAAELCDVCGDPPVLDLVHLGLGADGHTASLVPGDPVLDATDREVAATGEYDGRRRLTLTFPVLNRARQILWLVSGADRAEALAALVAGDPAIPAGRVARARAELLTDLELRAAGG